MAQTQERPRIITEIQVRVDCNGCVQKIKKALRGINGISDVYIDLPRQKLTIVGWADPERIIKAVKKARKNATIYSHSELQEPPPSQPSDTAPQDGEAPPPPDEGNPPANQSQPPQPDPPKDQPSPPTTPQPPENPPPENPATHEPAPPPENPTTHEPPPPPLHPTEPQHNPHNSVEEVHVIHHHPPDHSYRNRPGYGPGYNSVPPGYNQAYDNVHSHGPPGYSQGYGADYSPEHPQYSQRYGPSFNPGPPGYSQGYGPGPPSYSQGYNEPRYNPVSPDHHQGYEPSYNPGTPGHSHSHGYGGDWSGRPEPSYRPERPQPVQVTHSYNQYRPAPNVTQYGYVQSPPRYTPYARTENVQSLPRYAPYASTESYYYSNGDYQSNDNNNGYMASMLSEENPNACTIS